jgi:group I intron endonuclease
MAGIYSINIGDELYVGSTTGTFEKRFKKHLSDLNGGRHCNYKMRRLYQKHSEIVFKILEVVDGANLLEREQFYIDILKPTINICPIAGNSKGRVVSEETKEKIRKKLKGKSLPKSTVDNQTKSKLGKKLTQQHKDNIAKSTKIGKEKYRREIVQKTLEGEVIKIWISVSEIHRILNYHTGNICACCKGRKKNYKGYIWSYNENN